MISQIHFLRSLISNLGAAICNYSGMRARIELLLHTFLGFLWENPFNQAIATETLGGLHWKYIKIILVVCLY